MMAPLLYTHLVFYRTASICVPYLRTAYPRDYFTFLADFPGAYVCLFIVRADHFDCTYYFFRIIRSGPPTQNASDFISQLSFSHPPQPLIGRALYGLLMFVMPLQFNSYMTIQDFMC